jgi:hypothetical protein
MRRWRDKPVTLGAGNMRWARQNPDRKSGQQALLRPDGAPEAPTPAPAPPSPPPRMRLVEPKPAPDADWSKTVHLVDRFAAQLKATEARVSELEHAYRELSERAERELALMAHRLEHSELCAKDAGERRREAEEWLRRIHDAIHKRFGADMMVSIARDATRR